MDSAVVPVGGVAGAGVPAVDLPLPGPSPAVDPPLVAVAGEFCDRPAGSAVVPAGSPSIGGGVPDGVASTVRDDAGVTLPVGIPGVAVLPVSVGREGVDEDAPSPGVLRSAPETVDPSDAVDVDDPDVGAEVIGVAVVGVTVVVVAVGAGVAVPEALRRTVVASLRPITSGCPNAWAPP